MSTPGTIPSAGIILAGTFPEHHPGAGLETTLRLFELAEDLGYDVAGIRQRHLERGVSAALPFLAAASQRTRTIRLETDVVPLGYETPFRLAEDFATVDALSGGRVNVGVSTSAPHGDLLASLGRTDAAATADPYALIERFLESLEGHALSDDELSTPYGPQIPRVQPHISGLRDRVWLGGGSLRSVRWAAARGLKLLLGNVGDGDAANTFEAAQRAHVDAYLSEFRGTDPRIGVERVILPTDSATAAQREHYAAYVGARDERTAQPVSLGGRTVRLPARPARHRGADRRAPHGRPDVRRSHGVARRVPLRIRRGRVPPDPHRHPDRRPAARRVAACGCLRDHRHGGHARGLTSAPAEPAASVPHPITEEHP